MIQNWLARTTTAVLLALAMATIGASAQADDLSGCWAGHWQSCRTGHRGPLQAQFVRLAPDTYEVHFAGRFFKVIPFRYSIVMTAIEQDGVVHLSGSQNLGRLFGTFSFSAVAASDSFDAHYRSTKDNGRFVLCKRSGSGVCCGN
jgi:hypothetical protein